MEVYQKRPHLQLIKATDDDALRAFVKAWGPRLVSMPGAHAGPKKLIASPEKKSELKQLLESALGQNESKLDLVGALHGKQIGLTPSEVREYLEGFNYRLGERERTAMQVFRKLYQETEVTV